MDEEVRWTCRWEKWMAIYTGQKSGSLWQPW